MHTSTKIRAASAGALVSAALLSTMASAEPMTAVRAIPLPSPVVQGLAYADGSLWTLSPMGPGMTTLIRMDPGTGVPTFSFFGAVEADALAHDGTSLYATSTSGAWLCGGTNPNRIEVLDPVTGTLIRTLPSPAATATGGLAFLDGSLHAAAIVDDDPCDGLPGIPAVTEIDPADGSVRGRFETGSLGPQPGHLTSNGAHLLFGSWTGEEGLVPSSFRWTVYSLDDAGQVVDSKVLFETQALTGSQASLSFDVGGMAWGNGELFVLDYSTQTVQVFAFPVAEPPPPPPMPAPEVSLDILPGDDENCINLRSKGKLPAAVLSSASFDAARLDPSTVTLASAPVVAKKLDRWMAGLEDVNGDGLPDLVLHFRTQELELTEADTDAVLKGWTFDGEPIECSDAVKVRNRDLFADRLAEWPVAEGDPIAGAPRLEPLGNSLNLAAVGGNPTRGNPVVSFSLPGSGPATIEVVGVTGRRMSRQEIGHLGSGTHTLSLASPALPAGTYFVRLRQGAATAVTKVSVLP